MSGGSTEEVYDVYNILSYTYTHLLVLISYLKVSISFVMCLSAGKNFTTADY